MNVYYDMLDHGSRRPNVPKLIVVHSMGEYIKDKKQYTARDWLDHLKLSAHELVHPNGDVTVCRSDDQRAYHAGGDFNADSLGIEILVPGIHNYGTFLEAIKETGWCGSDAFNTAVSRVRGWMKMYDIPLEKVVRHSDIAPGRKVDPGAGFEWDRLKMAINP